MASTVMPTTGGSVAGAVASPLSSVPPNASTSFALSFFSRVSSFTSCACSVARMEAPVAASTAMRRAHTCRRMTL